MLYTGKDEAADMCKGLAHHVVLQLVGELSGRGTMCSATTFTPPLLSSRTFSSMALEHAVQSE